ncbi:MAG TPA: hypothetical protein VNB64_10490, partial [Solirubrobacteraceae bacterium]|nr:hypothetical protein [Solirubrobacteraceae bacterium]
SFASGDEGYAVGAGGTIERFDGDGWTRERANATEDLETVASGSAGAIAGGAHGTLLRRGEDSWRAAPEAPGLVGGQTFTASAALDDGTFLAAAGGAIVTAKGDGDWKAAEVAPLAQDVERLSGYRDLAGHLHVLALVNTGSDKILLDGDRHGWKPIPAPVGVRLVDAQLSGEGGRLWVIGMRGETPVAARVQPPARTVAGTGNFLADDPAAPIAAKDR